MRLCDDPRIGHLRAASLMSWLYISSFVADACCPDTYEPRTVYQILDRPKSFGAEPTVLQSIEFTAGCQAQQNKFRQGTHIPAWWPLS